ncbi:MAG: 3-phosphoshikimate 1-carboxyvinyltransferase [Microscillaceae bacterium]|jgi:3-phosphoshikimate 1-carboxyvinyltransferase|nr:3-phosphoshikimate 1-carboxyvinyltransferase [Microscillaceae bacterium]
MKNLQITPPELPIQGKIALPSSKSESNRALIIQALAQFQSGQMIDVQNISTARDTQTMLRLLQSSAEVLDVLDAGTTMRFLTAYLAVTTNTTKTLTGTPRMCERPIGILVEALQQLGFSIDYGQNEGFPPLKIHPTTSQPNKTRFLQIRGDVSSQYISALLMIAPLLPEGLELKLLGKIGSRPYIEMTLAQMQHFGIAHTWHEQTIAIPAQTYQAQSYAVESDWSGASYWYSVISLALHSEIELLGLKSESLQGDSVIVDIMGHLGVRTQFTATGAKLTCKPIQLNQAFEWDFTACPDLAQTVLALGAVKRIPMLVKGLESLKIKETDRVQALQNEIRKFGCELHEEYGYWSLRFGAWADTPPIAEAQKPILIETYDDHRMAMAFAPLALVHLLKIENPSVVNKSYPSFWRDMESLGFGLREE